VEEAEDVLGVGLGFDVFVDGIHFSIFITENVKFHPTLALWFWLSSDDPLLLILASFV